MRLLPAVPVVTGNRAALPCSGGQRFSFPMGSLSDEPIFWTQLLVKGGHTEVGLPGLSLRPVIYQRTGRVAGHRGQPQEDLFEITVGRPRSIPPILRYVPQGLPLSGSAAACTRAATFAVSPNTSPPSAMTTGPVCIPMRTERRGLHPNPPPLAEVLAEEGVRVPSSVAISGNGGGLGRRLSFAREPCPRRTFGCPSCRRWTPTVSHENDVLKLGRYNSRPVIDLAGYRAQPYAWLEAQPPVSIGGCCGDHKYSQAMSPVRTSSADCGSRRKRLGDPRGAREPRFA
jgi:hypothetical protein